MIPSPLLRFLLGIEGLALLREWFAGDSQHAAARMGELAELLEEQATPMPVAEVDVKLGYGAWASRYDKLPNPLILMEEPVVNSMVDRLPIGRAADVACGTGRHAAYLAAAGHRVIGVDASPEMLRVARSTMPTLDVCLGDLSALPLKTESVDIAVCGLALTHEEDLLPGVLELGRVVRRDGCVVISNLHPFWALTGAQAFFIDAEGSPRFIRDHAHLHGAYLNAFETAHLRVRQCIEPTIDEAVLGTLPGIDRFPDAFRCALLGLPGALVWELQRD